jgi:ATP-dependent Clp protease ATP-binding subunit ClpC
VAELGYQLNLSDKAKAFIAEKGFDKQFGARPLKSDSKYVEDTLAEEIITSKITSGDEIFMDIEEGTRTNRSNSQSWSPKSLNLLLKTIQ